VRSDAEHGFVVTLDGTVLGASTAPLRDRLSTVLERLPVKTRLDFHEERP
jgi:hypothetical protein